MAGKQISGDALSVNMATMSKSQLYEIMFQMKSLIQQNQQQARNILIQNPPLTRALFQAQIMLGMVQAPQAVQSIPPQASSQPLPSVQQTKLHEAQSTPNQVNLPDQANVPQVQEPVTKQQQHKPTQPISSNPVQGFHPQSLPPQAVEQSRVSFNFQASQMAHPQSSQVSNMPALPTHAGPQQPLVHQPPVLPVPDHSQPPMQATADSHHLLQPQLPPHLRPPMQMQHQPPMGVNMNFQNAGIPQMHHSQPMFHNSGRPPPGGMKPFPQLQPPLSHQRPHQPMYQGGGPHLNLDFNNQNTGNMQVGRGSSWPPGSRENTAGIQSSVQSSIGAGQPIGNQPPRPPPLTPEVEQQLLQQVMSLTPEQINLLPPEQRHQVHQLQQMLRQ
ncbi:unnamed protein product [Amaranthus hypochondriacus]